MTVTDLEIDGYSISVTSGTPLTNQALATVNGDIKEINVRRRQSRGSGSDYDIVIVHDNVSTTTLLWSVITIELTKGIPLVDQVFATVSGVVQAAKVIATSSSGNRTTYDVLAIHL